MTGLSRWQRRPAASWLDLTRKQRRDAAATFNDLAQVNWKEHLPTMYTFLG
jgi:hypothetical protein